jgi:hypothetical protein
LSLPTSGENRGIVIKLFQGNFRGMVGKVGALPSIVETPGYEIINFSLTGKKISGFYIPIIPDIRQLIMKYSLFEY